MKTPKRKDQDVNKTSVKKEFIGAMVPTHLAKRLRDAARLEKRSVSNMLEIFLEHGDYHLPAKRKRA
jgi:hypothetical protein